MAKSVAQPPVEKKRILVVDAYPMLRHGLVTYLNEQPDLIVCGEADSIPSALIKIAECKPHLLVIGLRLGAADCVEFVKALKVSVKTIETHRENIKHKLGLNSGQALIERATKYVEETLEPRPGETISVIGKKKLVRFPAA